MADLPKILCTREQVRAILGDISEETLSRWIAEKKIPGPWNGTTRWDVAALELAVAKASKRRPTLDVARGPADDPVARDAAELDRMFGR